MQIFSTELNFTENFSCKNFHTIFQSKFRFNFLLSVELSVEIFSTDSRSNFRSKLSVQNLVENFPGIWSASDREGRATRGP